MTLPDFFVARFGKAEGLLSVIILLLGWVFFIAGEIAVIGKVFQSILGWDYTVATIVVILGLVGFALVSEGILSTETISMVHEDAELIIPLMVKELFPLPLAIMFNIAIVAAVMSVADGGVLAISTLFTNNVIKGWIKPDMGEKKLLLSGRLFVVVFGCLTVLIGLAFPNVFLLTMLLLCTTVDLEMQYLQIP